jgi:hypothetical protein
VGVHAPDRYRVDVAVDLSPSMEGIRLELAVEEPSGAELVSMTLIDHHEAAIDRRMHLRRAPEAGVHTLHVGVFYQDTLVDHVRREFSFPDEAGTETPGEESLTR